MKLAPIPLISAALAAAIFFYCAAPAHASDWSNAVDVCQGALPNFEGALRKRPLAIANEGASPSFVSCSLRTPLSAQENVTGLIVLFTNRAAAAQAFSCTLVEGVAAPFGSPVFQPKATVLPAGAFGALGWDQHGDNGGDVYEIPNLNCALPPGVEINVLQVNTAPA